MFEAVAGSAVEIDRPPEVARRYQQIDITVEARAPIDLDVAERHAFEGHRRDAGLHEELLQLLDDTFETHRIDGLSEQTVIELLAEVVRDDHAMILDERQRMAGQSELHDLVDRRRRPRCRIQCLGSRRREPVEEARLDRCLEYGEQSGGHTRTSSSSDGWRDVARFAQAGYEPALGYFANRREYMSDTV